MLALVAFGTLTAAGRASAEPATGRNPNAPPQTAQLEFFVGEWDLTTKNLQPDGSFVEGRARSTVHWALDGFVLQDDYRALDAQGRVVFRGTSLRSYDVVQGRWTITWVMANIAGHTQISARMNEKGELVMEGKGHDPYGDFLEKARYYDISEDRYSFDLARSYDGGSTWLDDFGHIEATRRTPAGE